MKSCIGVLLVPWLLVAKSAAAPSGPARLRLRASSARRKAVVKGLFPYYHSTEEIQRELSRLAGSCPGFELRRLKKQGVGEGRAIEVVTVRAPGTRPVNKNFLLFGEHAREMISPESGLHLLRSLCGETALAERARSVLAESEFQVVVNGNPGSRRKVEAGEFCLRTNPDGVDLNRNWDEEWRPVAVLEPAATDPGPRPFSEPETQIFKELVEAYRPTTFLTVHSGTKGMYMPWAYDRQHLAKRNQPEMMQILKDVDRDRCTCPFGAAGREVGYSCPGTCLDWVYDRLQTPYAFAFEIYGGSELELRQRWEQKIGSGGAFYQVHSHLAHRHFKDLFQHHPSSFVQVRSEQNASFPDVDDCFALFNPTTEESYWHTIENWSAAYLDVAAMVAADLKRKREGSHSHDNASSQRVNVRV